MLTVFLTCLAVDAYHFAGATIYDAKIKSLREGVEILVNGAGIVQLVADRPIPDRAGAIRIENAVVLPHLSDFYSLVQERGLGLDEDLDLESQGRMARYYKAMGMYAVRDPIFPRLGLSGAFDDGLMILAQRGYLDIPGGPGDKFSLLANPDQPPQSLGDSLPENGPITLWWTSHGMDAAIKWPQFPDYVHALISYLHQRGHPVGCHIQDATEAEVRALKGFAFDFLEGIPANADLLNPDDFPGVIWAPLASLNDKRYCAKNLEQSLTQAARLGLYDRKTITLAESRVDSVVHRIRDRCGVWRKRRAQALHPVTRWLTRGGAFAIGSGGGHLFAFSGDIRTELEVLEKLGASQPQLLEALFTTTPRLLGADMPYLQPGRAAHFIAYEKNIYWGRLIGHRADYNFIGGKLLTIKDIQIK